MTENTHTDPTPGHRQESGGQESGADRIDWSVAAGIGKRLSRPGPTITEYTREAAYAELLDAATRAEAPVREVTGLADGLRIPTTRVLDRNEWVDAAARSMQSMLGTEPGTSSEEVPSTPVGPAPSPPGGLTAIPGRFWRSSVATLEKVPGTVGGAQAGALLAFLSSAILGQYDPFTPDPDTGEPGVLMVVAPNIITVERNLKVVPSDFRLWVCLHEVTHRVQFSANPWLRQYMTDNIEVLTSDAGESVSEVVSRITEAVRSDKPREKGVVGAMQLMQSPEQYEAFNRMMMLGTLLEGHADHVMDAVGPAHVPTVAAIRKAFDGRRAARQSPLQRIFRALIGMDAKLAQYVRGKAFVDEVVAAVGMERFNTIWSSPETMPLPAEITEPTLWIERVL
ncbi:hydrolase [Gordonia pseudamarae]|uniref:Hydrolase n=1 Tax=Gordonia pseudamarae TaxID=2831662 RepID=A0ABX6IFR1_9ACTN|nr:MULTISPECIES: zinc-dependent metalloprotease [Gordonia]MBD0021501.1 zinc-dependent metalloprotease [Gordonia sp. (in: high G+C Gram-positive bacteria)]QHN25198.1 hydrolase [Gordonia pseudamarae]QHN34130.1 hydrolase [Gordonia pseudamarae]